MCIPFCRHTQSKLLIWSIDEISSTDGDLRISIGIGRFTMEFETVIMWIIQFYISKYALSGYSNKIPAAQRGPKC